MSGDSTYQSVDESARRRFEAALRSGASAAITEHLPAPADPRFLATLEELVHIELERRWKAYLADSDAATALLPVEEPRVEQYLERYPELQQPAILARLVKQEGRVRQLHGGRPTAAEYLARFPHLV